MRKVRQSKQGAKAMQTSCSNCSEPVKYSIVVTISSLEASPRIQRYSRAVRFCEQCFRELTERLCRVQLQSTSVGHTTTPTAPTPPEVKAAPINLAPNAIAKVQGIMAQENPALAGVRVGVAGGGLLLLPAVRHQRGHDGQSVRYGRLKVFVDATSIMYLNGCRVDYVETLEGAGFKFENPNVKSTCGCGSSFNV